MQVWSWSNRIVKEKAQWPFCDRGGGVIKGRSMFLNRKVDFFLLPQQSGEDFPVVASSRWISNVDKREPKWARRRSQPHRIQGGTEGQDPGLQAAARGGSFYYRLPQSTHL